MPIVTNIAHNGFVPTSRLSELTVWADSSFVDLSLSFADSGDYQLIFSQRYFTYGNTVTVYELDDIVQGYMVQRNASSGKVRLSLTSETESVEVDFDMLFCSMAIDSDGFLDFLQRSFLTPQRFAVVPRDFAIDLCTIDSDTPIEVSCRMINCATDEHFMMSWAETPKAPATGFVSRFSLSRSTVDSNVFADHELKPDDFRLLYIVVMQGKRAFTAFVNNDLSMADSFRFLNTFNCMSLFTTPGVRTKATKAERQLASVAGVTTAYDLSVTSSVSFQSGVLPDFATEAVNQLCCAQKVWAMRLGEWEAVTVNDVSCEMSDDNSKLNTFKLTYSFDTRLDRLAVPGVSDVFSEQFNPVFN